MTRFRSKSRSKNRLKSIIIWLHKWLGVALALFFAMWFASGIVLYFVPFPLLTEDERLSGMAPIVAQEDCCLSAAQAARQFRQQTGQDISTARLSMYDGRPVWRVLAAPGPTAAPPAVPRWRMLDARSGALLPALDGAQAAAVAQDFSGRAVRSVQALERDQWTVPQGLNPYRPLYKVSLAGGANNGTDHGDDGLQVYVSAGSGEVVRDTRRMERFWNWLGAVPHWIYPTVLREIPRLWHHVVVWLSIPAVVVALSGVALGVWQLFLNRSRWIPYRAFWMRWHHILGLVAAVFTFTWMLSGLFSMNPFALFSAQQPTVTEARQWQGGARTVASATATADLPVLPPVDGLLPLLSITDALALADHAGLQVRELSLIHVGGQTWYWLRTPARQTLLHADPGAAAPALHAHLPDALMMATLTALRETVPQQLHLQQAYDGDYYSREPDTAHGRWRRPLPVWRAQWEDGVRVYADPSSGRIILRGDGTNRWQRVLYNGLHSLDFAPLIQRPGLRTTLVVGLSLVGLAMCLTACVLAWRVVVPRKASSWRKRRGHGLTRRYLQRSTRPVRPGLFHG